MCKQRAFSDVRSNLCRKRLHCLWLQIGRTRWTIETRKKEPDKVSGVLSKLKSPPVNLAFSRTFQRRTFQFVTSVPVMTWTSCTYTTRVYRYEPSFIPTSPRSVLSSPRRLHCFTPRTKEEARIIRLWQSS